MDKCQNCCSEISVIKKVNKAYSILNNHKLSLDNESGIEAEWLAGWVSLHHLNKPEK